MQVRIDPVSGLAERIQAGKRRSGYPHVTRGKLGARKRQFSGDSRARAMVFARRETIAKIGGRGAQISLRGERTGPGIERCKLQVR